MVGAGDDSGGEVVAVLNHKHQICLKFPSTKTYVRLSHARALITNARHAGNTLIHIDAQKKQKQKGHSFVQRGDGKGDTVEEERKNSEYDRGDTEGKGEQRRTVEIRKGDTLEEAGKNSEYGRGNNEYRKGEQKRKKRQNSGDKKEGTVAIGKEQWRRKGRTMKMEEETSNIRRENKDGRQKRQNNGDKEGGTVEMRQETVKMEKRGNSEEWKHETEEMNATNQLLRCDSES